MPSRKAQPISAKSAILKYELSKKQIEAVEAIKNNKIVVLRGKAGTSKTFTAVYAALKLLNEKEIKRISLTRPLVTTEKMGYLPGALEDKFDPFLAPVIEFFNKFGDNGHATFKLMVEQEKIRRVPIAFMRGITIEDEVLITDETQNVSPEQLLMILTRIGKNGKIVLTGDEKQSDLSGKENGMSMVVKLAEKLPIIKSITFTENMRDPIINDIIEAWEEIHH
jgi:phosphate starvation-inducible protein PhoH and related proteins